jgi:5-methylcytosine-specific restriction endonuclease McrA
MLTKINKTVKNVDNKRNISDMNAFFLQIWNNRKQHDCENCGKWLGKEPLSYMFDHLLEKSKYPDLAKEEDNIMLVCLECHDNKTRGFLTDFVRQKILELRKKYNK